MISLPTADWSTDIILLMRLSVKYLKNGVGRKAEGGGKKKFKNNVHEIRH
jgi:hypothetical protein